MLSDVTIMGGDGDLLFEGDVEDVVDAVIVVVVVFSIILLVRLFDLFLTSRGLVTVR